MTTTYVVELTPDNYPKRPPLPPPTSLLECYIITFINSRVKHDCCAIVICINLIIICVFCNMIAFDNNVRNKEVIHLPFNNVETCWAAVRLLIKTCHTVLFLLSSSHFTTPNTSKQISEVIKKKKRVSWRFACLSMFPLSCACTTFCSSAHIKLARTPILLAPQNLKSNYTKHWRSRRIIAWSTETVARVLNPCGILSRKGPKSN